MSIYDSREQRISRLRKLVIHSADARTVEVIAYLERVAKKTSAWNEKKQVLKEFSPLAEHLPAAFVDFALGYLIEPRKSRHESWMDDDPGRLGIRRVSEYLPAAPVQGPFLVLLRKHGSEGLRLVHGLVNAATERWRVSERRGRGGGIRPRTAIPLRLALPGGEQTFWGDDYIYRWFRGTAVGPDAVVSALMALELWTEEQLAAGRDASELFLTILNGSESVAVLAVILSVGLARLGYGLDVLEPLIGSARIWHMDIMRLARDDPGTPIIHFLGRSEAINQVLLERNRLPQRRRDIRVLLHFYLFDENRQEVLADWVRTFGEPLSFQFEEEKTNPAEVEKREEEVADFRPFLDRENYRASKDAEGGIMLEYYPPETVLDRVRRDQEAQARTMKALSLVAWAQRSIEQGSLAEQMNASLAIQAAQSLMEEDSHETPTSLEDEGLDRVCIEAIAGVAAAVLTATPLLSLQAEEVDWLRSVLIVVTDASRTGVVIAESHHPSEPKVSAALGLGALIADGETDQQVRQSLLLLAADAQHQVVAAVIRGLRDAWLQDPALCWNCLSLAVSFCCIPETALVPSSGLTLTDFGGQWINTVWNAHLQQLGSGLIPDLPRVEVGESIYFRSDRMVQLLNSMPVDVIGSDPAGKQRLIRLYDDLMARTLEPEEEEETYSSRRSLTDHHWAGNFLRWSAWIATILDPVEKEAHVIRPVFAIWRERPRLLDSLLFGYLEQGLNSQASLPEQAVATWERIWDNLLEIPELKSRAHRSDSWSWGSDFDTLAVFVSHGRYFYQESWPHAPRFTTLIDRWVKTIGVTHVGYHALITMLKPNVERFAPATILGWIRLVVCHAQRTG